jgi:hypothetical protein
MKKPLTKSGTCKHCTINCWAERGGKPAIWPCGLEGCPYPRGEVVAFPKSMTGSSMLQIASN